MEPEAKKGRDRGDREKRERDRKREGQKDLEGER